MSTEFALFSEDMLSKLCEGASHKKQKALRDLQNASKDLFFEMKKTNPEERLKLKQSDLIKKSGVNKAYLAQNPDIRDNFVIPWIEKFDLQFPRQNLTKSSDLAAERNAALHQAMAYHQKFLDEQRKVKKLEDEITRLKQENETLLSQVAKKPNNVVKLGD